MQAIDSNFTYEKKQNMAGGDHRNIDNKDKDFHLESHIRHVLASPEIDATSLETSIISSVMVKTEKPFSTSKPKVLKLCGTQASLR